MEHSFFEQVTMAPPDAIFQQALAFKADTRPFKVDLNVGLYRDEKLQTPVLETVKAAEKYLLAHETSKEYLPINGDPIFIEACGRLIFGDLYQERICGMQVPGGTGGLKVGADFVKQEVSDTITLPDPTWPNHRGVFHQSGFEVNSFSYYDIKNHQLNMQEIFNMLESIPAGSTVLFHACCHNPTGADLTLTQWEKVAEIMKQRQLLPFFDFAYQGFGRGIEEDAGAIRLFIKKGMECVVASSYSKNFGLYAERAGALFVATSSKNAAESVLSKLKIFARTSYSNPPKHGAAIVGHILSNQELKQAWVKEVNAMRYRLETLRKEFVAELNGGQKKRDFSYLLDRNGMFCFLGFEQAQVLKLKEEYGIYMAEGGRMNLAGLCMQNFNYVIRSLLSIL
jgi:aspartate aminotransferase